MTGKLLSLFQVSMSVGTCLAFHTAPSSRSYGATSGLPMTGPLKAVLDPTVATPKEYQDVCGIPFDEQTLEKRLETTKFLYPQHVSVIKDIEPIAQKMVDDVLLETGAKSWQPQDYLPDLTKEGWEDEVKKVREMAQGLSDDLFVVLIGDMVTEEALPTYQTLLNTFEGCDDPTGASSSAWAQWSRGWTSEENRHGDLLNKYLYLSGKCDMRNVEVTIQHLITNGFNPMANKDPYRGFVYTSFQERATKISHGRVGQLARAQGDTQLQKICAIIAGDEGRHEKAYQTFSSEIIKRDPSGFVVEMADVLRGQITMPAEQMTDGTDRPLYDDFAAVAQRLGVYTALDYADIIQHLVNKWDLTNLEADLTPQAEAELQYVCRLPERYRKLAERSMNKQEKYQKANPQDIKKPFGWIFGREA